MRILLVSYYFPPFNSVGALRPGKLARYLVQQGHDVHVLSCANQPYPRGLALAIPEGLVTYAPAWSINAPVEWVRGGRNKVANEGFSDGVASGSFVHKVGQLYKAIFHWPDAQLGWVGNAICAGRKILRDHPYDLIYASAPPFSGLRIAAVLSEEFAVPWIAEFRDLWTENHSYSFPAWRLAIEQRWETSLLSSVTALVTVSPPLAEKLQRFGRPVWEIRNGYSEEDYVGIESPTDFGEDPDRLNIVFTGNVYDGYYDVDVFCEGLALLYARGGKAKVHVAGRNTSGLRETAVLHQVEKQFVFHSTVPHAVALSMQHSADVLLTFLWEGGAGEGVYSAKLFEYAGAKRPILAVGDPKSDVGIIIESACIGKACTSAEALADQLQDWLKAKHSPSGLKITPDPSFNFTRSAQFSLLEARIHTLLEEYGHGRRVCFVIANIFALNAFLATPIAELSKNGWQVTVAVNSDDGPICEGVRRHATVVRVPIVRPISFLADISALWRLWRAFRNGRFDVVHSVTPKAGLLAMLASCAAFVPVRLHTFTGQVWATRKGPMRWLLQGLDFLIAKCATGVLADSLSQRAFLEANGVVKKGRLQVFESGSICGVDTKRFVPDSRLRKDVRAFLGIPPEAEVVLYVGRLHPEKGIGELLKAFKEVAAENTNTHLVLAGPDEGLLGQIRGNQDTRVHLVGMTTFPERYMASADVFCMPSHREGFGLTLLEAAATGLPSVSTNIYGVTDAVLDEVTGILVPVNSVSELAAALKKLLNNPELRKRMGERARLRVSEEFSQERLMGAWLRFYDTQLEMLHHRFKAISRRSPRMKI